MLSLSRLRLLVGTAMLSALWLVTDGRPSFAQDDTGLEPAPIQEIVGGQLPIQYPDGAPTQTFSNESWSHLITTGPAPGPTTPARRVWSSTILDPVRNRFIVFGGLVGGTKHGDVWAQPLSGPPIWTQITTTSDSVPSPRWGHSAIYDPVRDRMIVYGGDAGSGAYSDEIWALSLSGTPTWTRIMPTGIGPVERVAHAAVYDPVRDRMLVIAGYEQGFKNNVYALSLAGTPHWQLITPTGTPPIPRDGHAAVYDPVRDRVIVFGGLDGVVSHNDTWELSLGGTPAWTALSPAGAPPVRYGAGLVYDPVGDRLVLFGGTHIYLGPGYNDVWSLPLSGPLAWSQVPTSALPPSQRWGFGAIYDPAGARLVIFGGVDLVDWRNDTWSLPLSGAYAWSKVEPAPDPGIPGPTPRWGHVAIYDRIRDRMIIHGGIDGSVDGEIKSDIWALSKVGEPVWTQIVPTGPGPTPRIAHAAIYDPVRDRLVFFGGYDGGFKNDVWALSLSGTPTWTELHPTGTAPTPRDATPAVYDPVRDRMIFFGGLDGSVSLNDLWALSLSGTPAWTKLNNQGQVPAARKSHSLIYDPVGDQIVLHGGTAVTQGPGFSDVWTYGFTGPQGWKELKPPARRGTLGPGKRWAHTAIYDPVDKRMVIFGGVDLVDWKNDVWSLPLANRSPWSPIIPAAPLPHRRVNTTAVYDGNRGRMIIFGGLYSSTLFGDAWALSLGSPPGAMAAETEAIKPAVAESEARFALYGPVATPVRGDLTVSFSLATGERSVVEVFSVTGRRLISHEVGSLGPGRHSVSLGGQTRLASGVYVLRLQQGVQSASQKFAVIR